MFHRVKPETQREDAAAESQTEIAEQAEEKAEDSKPVQASAAPAQPEKKFSPPTPQTPRQEKDIKPMSDRNPNKDFESQNEQSPRALDMPSGAFQRPQPTRPMGGYPGAYPGSSYAASAPRSEPKAAMERTLTIGSGITMSGEIESCDYLLVEGTVEAALKGASVLEIAESGVFYGTVEINEANIAGRFEGDITVNGRLTIRASGTITGSIAYGELEVESGAVIDGRLTPLSSALQAAKAPAKAKAAAPAAPKAKASAKDEQPVPANSDGELFSNKAAAAE